MYINMYINICKGYPKYFFHCLMAPKSILCGIVPMCLHVCIESKLFQAFRAVPKIGAKKT